MEHPPTSELVASGTPITIEPTSLPYRPFTDHDIQRNGQKLLDDDPGCPQLLHDLGEEIRERYDLFFISNPEEAELKRAELLRTIALTAFSSVLYTGVLHEITPILETHNSAASLINGEDYFFYEAATYTGRANDNTYEPADAEYTGSAARYMNSMINFLRRNTEMTMRDMSDTSHPHFHLHEATRKQDRNLRAWKAMLGKDYAKRNVVSNWSESTSPDNVKVSLEIILDFWLSQVRSLNRTPSKDEFMRSFSAQVDIPAWASSINKDIFRPIGHLNLIGTKLAAYEDTVVDNIETLFPERESRFVPSPLLPRVLVYNHPSLVNGPWPKSGKCPANAPQQAPLLDDQIAVERFFGYFERRFGVTIPRLGKEDTSASGTYDRATVLLLIGLAFSEPTILDKLPVSR